MNKLTIYIPSFENGGAERVASVLINYWSEKNKYSLKVINTLPKNSDFFYIDDSVQRIFLDYHYDKNGVAGIYERFHRVHKLRRVLKANDGKTIVSFMTQPSILLLLASIGLGRKIICCEHNNYYLFGNKFTRTIRDLLYYVLATKVTLLTERDKRNYPKYLHSKISILPNPIGVDGFKTPSKFITHPIRLLFVGRLVPIKGISRLLSILGELKTIHNWELTICGDGELKSLVEDKIKEYHLDEKVTLAGSVTNIEDYYIESDLLMMTSVSEGLPMVIAESMSFGVPVIAFDCPTGPREFIDHQKNGLLIEDGNIKSYVQELIDLINNPNKLAQMSAVTKASVDYYRISNIDKIWDRVINI